MGEELPNFSNFVPEEEDPADFFGGSIVWWLQFASGAIILEYWDRNFGDDNLLFVFR